MGEVIEGVAYDLIARPSWVYSGNSRSIGVVQIELPTVDKNVDGCARERLR
jgi:hypothetical protein